MYRSEVHYEYIARAVAQLPCPVLANGNIYSVTRAREVLAETGALGLMIGRGVIRNPWLFTQIRRDRLGEPVFVPTGRDLLTYVHALYEALKPNAVRENAYVQKMKKYMNFIGAGVDPEGAFLHEMRRATAEREFFEICERYLSHDSPMPLAPFPMRPQHAED
jgi:tRNA-dihydrouridine synthase